MSVYSGKMGTEKITLKVSFDQSFTMMSTNSLVCSASELTGFSLSGVFVGWGRLRDWNREPREKEELLAAMFVGA